MSKILLPSSMALTMVAKLSSAMTISEASLVTSVPVLPMATPISAAVRAGASFTPSPVMATMWPLAFRASTMRTLCSAVTLANTDTSSMCSRRSSELIRSSWTPSITSPLPIPSSLPMALAVRRWSPVIMTVLMPAILLTLIASGTSFLGGSIMPVRPAKISPDSMQSTSTGSLFDMGFQARARTRRAFSAISSASARIDLLSSSVRVFVPLGVVVFVQWLSTTSGAPFMETI